MFDLDPIKRRLDSYHERGLRLFTTSSFQTHSLPLLHILSRLSPGIPVFFLNTGYHFPETLAFKDQVVRQLGLNLVELRSEIPKIHQKDAQGRLLFASDPDYCCQLNKVRPMEQALLTHDVWVNGVRADQSDTRKRFHEEEPAKHGVTRYHPMLAWTSRMVHEYRKAHGLPANPLEEKGYLSIGCEPCTKKFTLDGRDGRWFGMNKTECGLNTDLVEK